jgi:hypothetical protein
MHKMSTYTCTAFEKTVCFLAMQMHWLSLCIGSFGDSLQCLLAAGYSFKSCNHLVVSGGRDSISAIIPGRPDDAEHIGSKNNKGSSGHLGLHSLVLEERSGCRHFADCIRDTLMT